MVNNPESFIQEKLSKKALSANTIRDLLMALFLLILQKKEQSVSVIQSPEDWKIAKAGEIREKASRAFASIGAPFEYPNREQLIETNELLKKEYAMDQLSHPLQKEFEDICSTIFSKFS